VELFINLESVKPGKNPTFTTKYTKATKFKDGKPEVDL